MESYRCCSPTFFLVVAKFEKLYVIITLSEHIFDFYSDEQYRQLWVELETFLRCSRLTSKMHAKLFNYLRNDVDIDEENLDDSITATNDSKSLKVLANLRKTHVSVVSLFGIEN